MNFDANHTKLPWKLAQSNRTLKAGAYTFHILGGDGFLVAATNEGPRRLKEVAYANARRIVACVNACAGIDTDTLERMVKDSKKIFWYEEENIH